MFPLAGQLLLLVLTLIGAPGAQLWPIMANYGAVSLSSARSLDADKLYKYGQRGAVCVCVVSTIV